jgi:hypothetical protein
MSEIRNQSRFVWRHSRHHRCLSRLAGIALVLAVAAPASAQEQSSTLRVRLEAQDRQLGGALVALLDQAGRVPAEVLSTDRGTASLNAPPGVYRVRVRRIGYQPYYSEPISLPREGEFLVRVQSERVVLATMVVSAAARCGTVQEDAAALSTAWQEIAKALRASQITRGDLSSLGTATIYIKDLDRRGGIISADTLVLPAARGRPFAAVDPAWLTSSGYVRGNPRDGWEYFGPDEAVLLSPGFGETHCFRVVRDPKRAGDIGVAFEPLKDRRQADIAGVLWIDEKSSELREMTFRYRNVDIASRFSPGGTIRFRRLPSGAWIVNEWSLKLPKLAARSTTMQGVEVIGFIEKGGRVAATAALPGSRDR